MLKDVVAIKKGIYSSVLYRNAQYSYYCIKQPVNIDAYTQPKIIGIIESIHKTKM